MIHATDASPLRQQLEYYRARAGEYDQWWWRTGRYDRGALINSCWRAEGETVAKALTNFRPQGRILELAGGTGIWSAELLRFSGELTVVDGSEEMLAINAAKLADPRVNYVVADLFNWAPEGKFDTIFFSFWLSHLPPERFASFWQLVRDCLAPGGRVFFLDSRHEPASTATDHLLPEPTATVLTRKLNDGREFQIYKIFYEPRQLVERLALLGWDFKVCQTEQFFLYGVGQPV